MLMMQPSETEQGAGVLVKRAQGAGVSADRAAQQGQSSFHFPRVHENGATALCIRRY